MLLTSKSIINILYDVLAFTEAPLSSLHYGNNFSISLPVVDRRADCSSETAPASLASLHLVSESPQFLAGPPEFPWGSVSAVLAVQVLVAQCSLVPGLWYSL